MIVLVTCSGISNTSKLTMQAALILMRQWPGRYQWTHVKKSATSLGEEVRDADQIVVIEGCHDCCATKNLLGQWSPLIIISSQPILESKRTGWQMCSMPISNGW